MEHSPPDLNQVTLQEIFDYGVDFLRKQNAKSSIILTTRGEGGLLTPQEHYRYRTEQPDGRVFRCGAGCFLPDERYDSNMEGWAVVNFRNRFFNYEPAGRKMELLQALQRKHDQYDIEEWEDQWKNVAKEFELTYTTPNST